MESMNEISSSTPPNSKDKMMELPPSTSGASLGSSLALDCASGPKSLHLQGSKAGASLPCADSAGLQHSIVSASFYHPFSAWP
ncbi:unnamed protein product [Brassica rapa subsp. trilocularis]